MDLRKAALPHKQSGMTRDKVKQAQRKIERFRSEARAKEVEYSKRRELLVSKTLMWLEKVNVERERQVKVERKEQILEKQYEEAKEELKSQLEDAKHHELMLTRLLTQAGSFQRDEQQTENVKDDGVFAVSPRSSARLYEAKVLLQHIEIQMASQQNKRTRLEADLHCACKEKERLEARLRSATLQFESDNETQLGLLKELTHLEQARVSNREMFWRRVHDHKTMLRAIQKRRAPSHTDKATDTNERSKVSPRSLASLTQDQIPSYVFVRPRIWTAQPRREQLLTTKRFEGVANECGFGSNHIEEGRKQLLATIHTVVKDTSVATKSSELNEEVNDNQGLIHQPPNLIPPTVPSVGKGSLSILIPAEEDGKKPIIVKPVRSVTLKAKAFSTPRKEEEKETVATRSGGVASDLKQREKGSSNREIILSRHASPTSGRQRPALSHKRSVSVGDSPQITVSPSMFKTIPMAIEEEEEGQMSPFTRYDSDTDSSDTDHGLDGKGHGVGGRFSPSDTVRNKFYANQVNSLSRFGTVTNLLATSKLENGHKSGKSVIHSPRSPRERNALSKTSGRASPRGLSHSFSLQTLSRSPRKNNVSSSSKQRNNIPKVSPRKSHRRQRTSDSLFVTGVMTSDDTHGVDNGLQKLFKAVIDLSRARGRRGSMSAHVYARLSRQSLDADSFAAMSDMLAVRDTMTTTQDANGDPTETPSRDVSLEELASLHGGLDIHSARSTGPPLSHTTLGPSATPFGLPTIARRASVDVSDTRALRHSMLITTDKVGVISMSEDDKSVSYPSVFRLGASRGRGRDSPLTTTRSLDKKKKKRSSSKSSALPTILATMETISSENTYMLHFLLEHFAIGKSSSLYKPESMPRELKLVLDEVERWCVSEVKHTLAIVVHVLQDALHSFEEEGDNKTRGNGSGGSSSADSYSPTSHAAVVDMALRALYMLLLRSNHAAHEDRGEPNQCSLMKRSDRSSLSYQRKHCRSPSQDARAALEARVNNRSDSNLSATTDNGPTADSQHRHSFSSSSLGAATSEADCVACESASQQFAEVILCHCDGEHFSKIVKNSLLTILLTPIHKLHSVPAPRMMVGTFGKTVANPSVWQAFLSGVMTAPLSMRREGLHDMMSLLVKREHNLLSIVKQRGWQAWVIPLLYVPPPSSLSSPYGASSSSLSPMSASASGGGSNGLTKIQSAPSSPSTPLWNKAKDSSSMSPVNRNERTVEREAYVFAMNVFVLLHYHNFCENPTVFWACISDGLCAIQEYFWNNSETQQVCRDFLMSLFKKVQANKLMLFSSRDSNSVSCWSSLRDLVDITKHYLLCTPSLGRNDRDFTSMRASLTSLPLEALGTESPHEYGIHFVKPPCNGLVGPEDEEKIETTVKEGSNEAGFEVKDSELVDVTLSVLKYAANSIESQMMNAVEAFNTKEMLAIVSESEFFSALKPFYQLLTEKLNTLRRPEISRLCVCFLQADKKRREKITQSLTARVLSLPSEASHKPEIEKWSKTMVKTIHQGGMGIFRRGFFHSSELFTFAFRPMRPRCSSNFSVISTAMEPHDHSLPSFRLPPQHAHLMNMGSRPSSSNTINNGNSSTPPPPPPPPQAPLSSAASSDIGGDEAHITPSPQGKGHSRGFSYMSAHSLGAHSLGADSFHLELPPTPRTPSFLSDLSDDEHPDGLTGIGQGEMLSTPRLNSQWNHMKQQSNSNSSSRLSSGTDKSGKTKKNSNKKGERLCRKTSRQDSRGGGLEMDADIVMQTGPGVYNGTCSGSKGKITKDKQSSIQISPQLLTITYREGPWYKRTTKSLDFLWSEGIRVFQIEPHILSLTFPDTKNTDNGNKSNPSLFTPNFVHINPCNAAALLVYVSSLMKESIRIREFIHQTRLPRVAANPPHSHGV